MKTTKHTSATLNRFLGKNSDVAFILGEDTGMVGPMKQRVFGSRFKDYAAYREKISKGFKKYFWKYQAKNRKINLKKKWKKN